MKINAWCLGGGGVKVIGGCLSLMVRALTGSSLFAWVDMPTPPRMTHIMHAGDRNVFGASFTFVRYHTWAIHCNSLKYMDDFVSYIGSESPRAV